jgi:hypothetical protein
MLLNRDYEDSEVRQSSGEEWMLTPRTLLFKLDRERLGTAYVYILIILGLLQSFLKLWDLLWQPLLAFLFRLRGMSYYVLPRSETTYDKARAKEFFGVGKEILETAKEIKIALGEMGSALMESPELLEGLQSAYQCNHATIHIVHGPRVDPQTTTVFKFAQQGMVTLFMMPKYKEHHFFLITTLTNETIVIDEGVHNETLWTMDASWEIKSPYYSRHRNILIAKNSKRLVAGLAGEFDRRKHDSRVIYIHPRFSSPQDYSLSRIVLNSLRVPLRRTQQLLAAFFDLPIELPLRNGYTNEGDSKDGKSFHLQANGPNAYGGINMNHPEQESQHPVIEIPLMTTLEDIAGPPPCIICGYPTKKAYIDYSCGSKVVVRAPKTAGYLCTNPRCKEEYISNEAAIEVLTIAQPIMKERGLLETADTFAEVIERERSFGRAL